MALEENTTNVAEGEPVARKEQEGRRDAKHINLSDDYEDPPPIANPFVAIPQIVGTHTSFKENNREFTIPKFHQI